MNYDETQNLVRSTPKPKLLTIRWVCGVCLKVVYRCLDISWRWEQDRGNKVAASWCPRSIEGPTCHGQDMLILGEPKVDVHGLRGHGLLIDPLDEMRCPRI